MRHLLTALFVAALCYGLHALSLHASALHPTSATPPCTGCLSGQTPDDAPYTGYSPLLSRP